MNLLDQFIVSRSERYLARYRNDAAHVRTEFLREYYSYLPDIEQCYRRAGYWHGTGRYHYYRANDSRYEGVGEERVVDVLVSVLKHGGLTGHQDLWVTVDKHYKKTVSVTHSRMYARLFAHLHLHEEVWLEYVFGGTRFWMGLLITLSARELLFTLGGGGRKFIKQTMLSRASLQNFRTWGNAICRLDSFRILPIWRAYDLRSDIPGNYGILFGIKSRVISRESLLPLPFTKNFEVRVAGQISLADMTHVEVPLENVAETKRLLVEKGIGLPVIPLEFGELYCSRFPLTKLMHV